jgi:25S rRNA (uracil2634-N3)-methyltransferase
MCPRLVHENTKKDHIGLYDSNKIDRILTVGDGNFSFSLALARVLCCSKDSKVHLIATSHESRDSVIQTYPDGEKILQELSCMKNVQVYHGIDATSKYFNNLYLFELCLILIATVCLDPEQMQTLGGSFDRILWNFPCVRVPRGEDGQNKEMEMNKILLNDFFTLTSSLLTQHKGQVHVTHKTKPPFGQWEIEKIAERNGLKHAHSVIFDRCFYPGYSNKKVLDKGSFPIWDSQTFVFVLQDQAEAFTSIQTYHGSAVPLISMKSETLDQIYQLLQPTAKDTLQQSVKKQKKRRQENDFSKRKKRKFSASTAAEIGLQKPSDNKKFKKKRN